MEHFMHYSHPHLQLLLLFPALGIRCTETEPEAASRKMISFCMSIFHTDAMETFGEPCKCYAQFPVKSIKKLRL